jgi:hypothetical protein
VEQKREREGNISERREQDKRRREQPENQK